MAWFSEKNIYDMKCVFWFSLHLFSEVVSLPGRIQQDIINIHSMSCKMPVIFVRFQPNYNWLNSSQHKFNLLTPNGLYSARAVSPLNSRTATIVAANSMSKFGGIFFTPIQLFTVVCYAAGPLKVRLSYRRQIVPPPPPKPLHIRRYIRLRLVNAHFSMMT